MNKISGKKNKTVVKIFINSVTAASLCYSPLAFSEENKGSTIVIGSGKSATEISNEQCASARDKLQQAQSKIGELCRKAGGGSAGDCRRKAQECGEQSSSESFDTVAAFGTILGLPAGSTNIASKCPQYNGRDYFTDKKDIEKDIADTEKELADLNDDKAKIEKDYKKEMNDLQEALSKAQEEYKKNSLEIDQKEREKIAEFQNAQNQAKDEMRRKGSELLNLKGKVIKLQQDKAKELITLSEAAGQRECNKSVVAARKAFEAVYEEKGSMNRGSFFKLAKRKKTELIDTYNKCMESFDLARKNLNANTRQAQDQYTKEMNDLTSSIDEVQNGLNLASSQLDELKQASLKEKSDAVQAVIDLGTRTQTQMESAYKTMQQNLQTLSAKSQSLTAKLNRLNQSLMALGPVPKRGSDYTIGEVGSEIDAQVDVIESLRNDNSICKSVRDAAGNASDRLDTTSGSGVQ